MGYIIIFVGLVFLLYSTKSFLLFCLVGAVGYFGYLMGKENTEEKVKELKKELVIEPLELDPDELKSPAEKFYDKQVENDLEPHTRIKHIIDREKNRLEQLVENYKRNKNIRKTILNKRREQWNK